MTVAVDLKNVQSWVFDMDDTLYPREQGVLELIQARISAFMIDAVGIPAAEAAVLQTQFRTEHGTTLAGLMANYAVDSDRFLRDVHDVPLDGLEPNPRLVETIAALPGRKFVLTNGARCHAGRVLEKIGFVDAFDGIYCIEDMDLVPKPAPATFRRFFEQFDIDPTSAAFFEDTPNNLRPAKTLGMTTVLIGDGYGQEIGPWVDHRIDDLLDFLTPLGSRDAQ